MSDALDHALEVLDEGGVVAAATESLFGLLADASSRAALDRLFSLKPRSDKGMPLILPSRESWSSLVLAIPEPAAALADRFWPGPLTLALRARPELDPRLLHEGRIAVRWPAPSPAAELARRLGRALTATSANPSGAPPADNADCVRREFADAVRDGRLLVLEPPAPGGAPSTVVVIDGARVLVVREGAIARKEIERVTRPGRGL